MDKNSGRDASPQSGPAPFPDTPPTDHLAQLSDPDRLEALKKTGMLDPQAEEAFDRITRLATRLLGVEVSLISVVDSEKQVFKSHDGLPAHIATDPQTPLSHSFCQYVVAHNRGLAVHDARAHPLLAHNGAVKDMNIIAYMGEPIHAPTGEPIGSLCAIHADVRVWQSEDQTTLRDLAAIVENELRLRAEAHERGLLIQEMQHRVKNLFTVSNSLLRLSAQDAADKDELVDLLQGRLLALAKSHDLALGDQSIGGGDGPTLAQLIEIAIAPYAVGRMSRIKFDGPDITMARDAVTYLAMSLHELATNAAKYGAFSIRDGALSVTWAVQGEYLRIVWEETAQIANADTVLGFGSDLLKNAIVFGIGGTCTRDLREDGLMCTINLPESAFH